MGKFIVSQNANEEYQFKLVSSNEQVILYSEGYTQRANCIKGINAVKLSSQNEDSFIRKIAANGKYYFTLKAKNGEILGTSQQYESEAARENAIYSVILNARNSRIAHA